MQHTHLATHVASAVGEEAVVVTARACRVGAHVGDTHRTGLSGDDRAQIDARRRVDAAAGQAAVHVGAHLVAAAADGWAEHHAQLLYDDATLAQETHRNGENVRRRAAPPG